ncbi:hypothetical protein DO97_18475 [Neosynechococcus sphagnicola sy1]|uniref:Uncharacterized protein n=1 Tax=Neosynechococcus sphagnicola sy1 TaxID=1497020 RepID=A0A098TMG3_9CYAN|nr:hypothetical protein [Neosynechococcus sphagnicola]KGF73494.1 hypothetical protein DO97_18475 [Neosynechococcus sphagnicola sy1]
MKTFTRRSFFTTVTLARGFALAVHPISVNVIRTDLHELIAGAVQISVADGVIPAYRAMPNTGNFSSHGFINMGSKVIAIKS